MPAHPQFRHGQIVHRNVADNTQTVYYDIDDDHGALVTEAIDDKILVDANNMIRNEREGERFGDMSHVASVPMNVAEDILFPALKNHDDDFVKKWLNDPDNRGFRTKAGLL